MAEICCGVVSCGAEASAISSCEPGSRAARRRRMEIRRLRFVPGVETPVAEEDEPSGKRLRTDGGVDTATGGAENSGSMLGGCESPECSPVADPDESGPLDQCPRFGMAAVCGRRRDMEDAVSIRPDFVRQGDRISERHHFFGVFDGHGCSHVASLCRDRMYEVMAEEVEALGPDAATPPQSWKATMERSFSRVDAEASDGGGTRPSPVCRCELQPPRSDHVGSTAVVAVVGATKIVVANCGDSRAVLCRNGVAIPLSSDHKPDREDELQRIEAAGGRVIYWDGARVLGVLAMSRAIGDDYLKPFVIPDPEVTVTEREEGDECLILASDGLWDVVSNETACDIARMCLRGGSGEAAEPAAVSAGETEKEEQCVSAEGDGSSDASCSDAAILLTKLALARQSADNISVVVVDLRSKRKGRTAAAN
ncbi:putative protein phosphatase 2C 68 [Canna indica]|uniref:protein-serine/threonine phosphatase n=1 Tax=Canna indica TaxID=4628 RepID=A0AAQ3QPC9_9LILI|nr:putative protein phosphatase 2C 68 [Canna indica]